MNIEKAPTKINAFDLFIVIIYIYLLLFLQNLLQYCLLLQHSRLLYTLDFNNFVFIPNLNDLLHKNEFTPIITLLSLFSLILNTVSSTQVRHFKEINVWFNWLNRR